MLYYKSPHCLPANFGDSIDCQHVTKQKANINQTNVKLNTQDWKSCLKARHVVCYSSLCVFMLVWNVWFNDQTTLKANFHKSDVRLIQQTTGSWYTQHAAFTTKPTNIEKKVFTGKYCCQHNYTLVGSVMVVKNLCSHPLIIKVWESIHM